MDRYLRNYWSLFLEFIDLFDGLKFHGIPLPLVTTFHHYLSEQAIECMKQPQFETLLRSPVRSKQELQPAFDRYLEPLRAPLEPKPQHGAILVYDGELRFSTETYSSFFAQDTLLYIPSHNPGFLNLFDMHDLTEPVTRFTARARRTLHALRGHPIFGDVYFQAMFLQQIPHIMDILNKAFLCFSAIPVRCVLLGHTEYAISRCLAAAAAANGIPSICMQHGLIGMEEGYFPIFAAKQAVYGSYEQDWFLERGASRQQIEIVGHPQFDAIFTTSFMNNRTFRQSLGIRSDQHIVLIGCSNYMDLCLLQSVVAELAQDPSIYVLIKAHPSEPAERYTMLTVYYDNVQMLKGTHDWSYESLLSDALANADAVIVDYSTVGLAAMLHDKPVFIWKMSYYDPKGCYRGSTAYMDRLKELLNRDYDYFDSLQGMVHTDPESLAHAVKEYLRGCAMTAADADLLRRQFVARNYPEHSSGNKLHDLLRQLSG
ncbi:CDP-glycerol glycerophosphotransferase family protein [Paenibacillus sp. y28]|uniref:CDP-glycerol glycerophosphotransferase family protein n=1 Tax=Paenibacillus sp. y28 TaxID=3129110 RepID=UPI0030198134